jgi:hypothetical protein
MKNLVNEELNVAMYRDMVFVPLLHIDSSQECFENVPEEWIDIAEYAAQWDYGDASPETALSIEDIGDGGFMGVFNIPFEGVYAVYSSFCGYVTVYVAEEA